jgi:cyanophycinase
MKAGWTGIAAGLLFLASVDCSFSQTATSSSNQSKASTPAHASFYRIGSAADAATHPRAGYALMGGGTDLDEAFRWLCERADRGDLVVLRASGDDAYNPYIQGMCQLSSVTTVVIPDHEAAMEPKVSETIRAAEAIFIAGGDQAKYTRFWRATPVESALRDAVKRGIPIGGTSAGLAVMGEFIYSAEGDKSDDPNLGSDAALADPFNRQVVVSPDLLGIPILRGVITDSHFDTRKRIGRLMVFMARILQSGQAAQIHGIGIAEKTALLVEADGQAHVVGKGAVQFFEMSNKTLRCKPGEPLQIEDVQTRDVHSGESFDLKTWQGPEKTFDISVILHDGKPDISMTWY